MNNEEPTYRLAIGAVADRSNHKDMDYAKKALHDQVIRDLGDTRGSRVQWIIFDSPKGVEKLPELNVQGGKAEGLKRFLLANPNGAMVIAMAECDEPVDADGGRV